MKREIFVLFFCGVNAACLGTSSRLESPNALRRQCIDLLGKYLSRINMREGNEYYGGPFEIMDYTVNEESKSVKGIAYTFQYKRTIGIMGNPDRIDIKSEQINVQIGRIEDSGDTAHHNTLQNFIGEFKENEKAQLAALLNKHKELFLPITFSASTELARIQNGKLQILNIDSPEILSIEKRSSSDFVIYFSEGIHDASTLKYSDYFVPRKTVGNISEPNHSYSLPDMEFYKIGNVEDTALLYSIGLFFQHTNYANIAAVYTDHDYIKILADQKDTDNKRFSLLHIPTKSVSLRLSGGEWTIISYAEIVNIYPEEGIGRVVPAFFLEKPPAEQIKKICKSFIAPGWCEDQLKAMSQEDLLQISEITLRNPLFYRDRKTISQVAVEQEEQRPGYVKINVEPETDLVYSMELIKINNRWYYYIPSHYFESDYKGSDLSPSGTVYKLP